MNKKYTIIITNLTAKQTRAILNKLSGRMRWGTPVEIETRRRILLSVWAYAYEIQNHSIVDDHTFDSEVDKVDLSIRTTRPDLDKWFVENFDPDTGLWIHSHPEIDKIERLYHAHYAPIE